MISESIALKFRRLRLLSARLSSSFLLPSQATNAQTMGASADDVPALSSLCGVVWSMGTTIDALPPGMVGTYSGFCP
jgi:hypothetical protein